MTPRDGNTDELKAGMYMVSSSTGEVLRCDGVTATDFLLTNAQGQSKAAPRPWQPVPITIMEPTPDEALAAVTSILGAEVVAERDAPGEPFRIVGLGNVLRNWHTHMFLMHGVWSSTGPGSKSLDKIKEFHLQDHEDALAGHPTGGGYVRHRH